MRTTREAPALWLWIPQSHLSVEEGRKTQLATHSFQDSGASPFLRPPLTPSLIPTTAQSPLEEDALLLKVDVALTTPKSEPTLSWVLWLIKSHCVPMPVEKPPLPPPDVLYRLKLNSGVPLSSPHLLSPLAMCFNYCPSQIFLFVSPLRSVVRKR